MWRTRTKSKISIHNPTSSSNFSCTSFKDIQNLCSDDSTSGSPTRVKKSNIFHRVLRANAVLRAFSNHHLLPVPEQQQQQPKPESNALSLPASEFKSGIKETHQPVLEPNALPLPLPEFKSGIKETHQPVPEQPEQRALPLPSPEFKSGFNETHQSEPLIQIPGAEERIVVYFTSLRVVRSTFDDCKAVRSILSSFRVSIDERDLSMDPRFMEELQKILGVSEKTKIALPRVFIGGRDIGGADEIRQLHETGELKKYVEGLAPARLGTCEACGGHRFVVCDECRGSHKCYSEKGGFRTCTLCNENGLIRCPSCYYAPL